MQAVTQDVPIRDAASVVLLRDAATSPKVLMGQRGKTAAFMPNKYVFPGGAVDPTDGEIGFAGAPDPTTLDRLGLRSAAGLERAILASAIREVWEETGLRIGVPGPAPDRADPDWAGFYEGGLAPSAAGLAYFFRAITPPGRPRRFDARFFLARAEDAVGDLDDFSDAQDELSHLHWVGLEEARALNLPFITEVVLAEVAGLVRRGELGGDSRPASVPFFNNSSEVSEFLRLS